MKTKILLAVIIILAFATSCTRYMTTYEAAQGGHKRCAYVR